MKKISLIFTSLLLASLSSFATEEFNVDKCMENASSNNAMKQCAATDYSLQDKNLNQIYAGLMKELKKDTSIEGVEIVKRVRAAQIAWIPLRDTTCSVESIDMLGGSGESLIYVGCLGRMTRERVAYLVELKKTFGF